MTVIKYIKVSHKFYKAYKSCISMRLDISILQGRNDLPKYVTTDK